MIDHDPAMVRAYIYKAINEKRTPLTETLIELLLVEVDLGVKAQAADAIKVLLEPQPPQPPQQSQQSQQQHPQQQTPQAQSQETMARQTGEFLSKVRGLKSGSILPN